MTDSGSDKTIYEQNCEDFRSLNDIMWKVPLLVMSLTGGLGVAVATFDLADSARCALLIFIGSINVAFILVLYRLRFVMDKLLKRIHEFQGTEHKYGYYVVTILSLILLAGAVGSYYYASNVIDLLPPQVSTDLNCGNGRSTISVVDQPDSERVILEVTCKSIE